MDFILLNLNCCPYHPAILVDELSKFYEDNQVEVTRYDISKFAFSPTLAKRRSFWAISIIMTSVRKNE